jgi:DHA1 family bicyclomycin/chloramphenicol resistance-like MFS transporter
MASCMGMVALSIDVMLPAFPDVRDEFGLAADSSQPSWIITSLFLGLAAGQLVYGPLSDRYGRKPLLNLGLILMAASAATCAVAPSLGVLVACRVAWGLGAAGPRSLALAMVRDRYAGDRMARTMSHITASFILVPAFAPSVGAAILTFAPWRTLFWLPGLAAVGVACWARRLPETLPPEHRRPPERGAFVAAAAEVVRSPPTIGFAIALTCLYGIMTAYIGGSQLIIDEVFGREDQFPIIFGALALFMALGSFTNARLVERVGLAGMLRRGAVGLVGAAMMMVLVAVAFDGQPPIVLFGVAMAILLPVVAVLMPDSNTAAMLPLPHVAGMAAALLGTVSTAGGALLGSVIDSRFDGTINPFAWGVLLYGLVAVAAIYLLGVRAADRWPRAVGVSAE